MREQRKSNNVMYYQSSTLRQRGAKQGGGDWTAAEVEAVWNKAQLAPGYPPGAVRKDACGALIERARHGDTTSPYGWEIDHIMPAANGGSDALFNLQPLQWENNRAKGDGPLACVRR